MMELCKRSDMEEILAYIGDSYGECLYLYIDLLKYGMDNDNVHIWRQIKDGEVLLILLQYYNGIHLFTKEGIFDAKSVAELLNELKPSMICGMKKTIDQVAAYMSGYEQEVGIVGKLKAVYNFNTEGCYCASMDEIKELAEILAEDESLGKPYGFDLLYKQLVERFQEKFGRNYIYRENGEIVATASTYAENENVAVISGVFVKPEFRGKGLSKKILSAICQELLNENIDVFSYYYIEAAHKMHASVGFEDFGQWSKLVRL